MISTFEHPLKNGRTHGIEYRADTPGRLLSAEPWVDGLRHGVARQWSDDGTLIGTYEMNRGTGTFAGPAKFDIILRALNGPQIIVSNHIAVNVNP